MGSKIYQDPLEMSINHLGKKWTIKILRDVKEGIKHFNQILENNVGLTPKILSDRLQILQGAGIVEKQVTSVNPVTIEYVVTHKEKLVNRLLYELAVFAALLKPGIVFQDDELPINDIVTTVGNNFDMPHELLELDSELRSQ